METNTQPQSLVLLNPGAKLYFRDELRRSRSVAQRDAEGYQEILFSLERLGVTIFQKKTVAALGQYRVDITDLARESPLAEEIPAQCPHWFPPFSRLLDLVIDGRNDALHQGAAARHLTSHAIQLTIILEDALMQDANTASDFMVRDPVCAYEWQPISLVRQTMLANAFTYLPIWIDSNGQSAWRLLSDASIAKYLHAASQHTPHANENTAERKRRLATPIREAYETGKLELIEADACFADDPVEGVLAQFRGQPILVIDPDHPQVLLGMIAAFDLL